MDIEEILPLDDQNDSLYNNIEMSPAEKVERTITNLLGQLQRTEQSQLLSQLHTLEQLKEIIQQNHDNVGILFVQAPIPLLTRFIIPTSDVRIRSIAYYILEKLSLIDCGPFMNEQVLFIFFTQLHSQIQQMGQNISEEIILTQILQILGNIAESDGENRRTLHTYKYHILCIIRILSVKKLSKNTLQVGYQTLCNYCIFFPMSFYGMFKECVQYLLKVALTTKMEQRYVYLILQRTKAYIPESPFNAFMDQISKVLLNLVKLLRKTNRNPTQYAGLCPLYQIILQILCLYPRYHITLLNLGILAEIAKTIEVIFNEPDNLQTITFCIEIVQQIIANAHNFQVFQLVISSSGLIYQFDRILHAKKMSSISYQILCALFYLKNLGSRQLVYKFYLKFEIVYRYIEVLLHDDHNEHQMLLEDLESIILFGMKEGKTNQLQQQLNKSMLIEEALAKMSSFEDEKIQEIASRISLLFVNRFQNEEI